MSIRPFVDTLPTMTRDEAAVVLRSSVSDMVHAARMIKTGAETVEMVFWHRMQFRARARHIKRLLEESVLSEGENFSCLVGDMEPLWRRGEVPSDEIFRDIVRRLDAIDV